MIVRVWTSWLVVAGISILTSAPCRAQDDDFAAVAKALPEATLSIGQALKLSEPTGKPISAGYEIQRDTLLLSIVTMKDDQFSEVVINAKSGSLEQVEPLADPDEIDHTRDQRAALVKSKIPLDEAVNARESKNNGYRAVSVMPMLDGEEPVATIILLKGQDVKRIAEKLK